MKNQKLNPEQLELISQRNELLRAIAHKIDRRNDLARRHAPEEWIDRYDEEIQTAQRALARIEPRIQHQINRDLATRRKERK